MPDDRRIAECRTFANVIVAEIKTCDCFLNGPWTKKSLQNMQRVLRALGVVTEEIIPIAAEALYTEKKWADDKVTVRLFAIGESRNDQIGLDLSQQVEWKEVNELCIQRFGQYKD